jgi:hypothetical protein
MMSDAPQFKSFVSEAEIEEKKKQRQEEWEKVRRPDQPLGQCSLLLVTLFTVVFLFFNLHRGS